ncbi:MAG: gluconate 2-dehydrogenase subunit 3 family protein [Gemmatimonadales bacterium]
MADLTASRREFLAAGGAIAAGWLGTDPHAFIQAVAAARAAERGNPVTYDVLTPAQAADLEAIAQQIVPSDDQLPGAREAHAVVFIDRALGSFQASQKDALLEGLVDLNTKVAQRWPGTARFAQLSSDRQHALLEEIEDTPFFAQVRRGVITGTFAHPQWGGNYEGAGWKILGFEPRFVWRPPFGAYDAEEMER